MKLALEPGEHVVWSSGKGGVVYWAGNVVMGVFVLGGTTLATYRLLRTSDDLSDALLTVLVMCGIAAYMGFKLDALPIGRRYYLTTRRLVRENYFGAPTALLIDTISSTDQGSLRTRSGNMPTGTVTFTTTDNQRLKLHQVADLGGLLWLLRASVVDKTLDLRELPALPLRGQRSETRSDFLFVEQTSAGWLQPEGPLLIGPTRLLHLRQPQSDVLACSLAALIGSDKSAAQIEQQALALACLEGSPLDLELSGVGLSLTGETLTITSESWTERIKLRTADAKRIATHLRDKHLPTFVAPAPKLVGPDLDKLPSALRAAPPRSLSSLEAVFKPSQPSTLATATLAGIALLLLATLAAWKWTADVRWLFAWLGWLLGAVVAAFSVMRLFYDRNLGRLAVSGKATVGRVVHVGQNFVLVEYEDELGKGWRAIFSKFGHDADVIGTEVAVVYAERGNPRRCAACGAPGRGLEMSRSRPA